MLHLILALQYKLLFFFLSQFISKLTSLLYLKHIPLFETVYLLCSAVERSPEPTPKERWWWWVALALGWPHFWQSLWPFVCSASFEVLAFYAYGPLETGASRPLLTDLHIQK